MLILFSLNACFLLIWFQFVYISYIQLLNMQLMNAAFEIIRQTEFTFIARLGNGLMRFGILGLATKDVATICLPENIQTIDDDQFDDFISELFTPLK